MTAVLEPNPAHPGELRYRLDLPWEAMGYTYDGRTIWVYRRGETAWYRYG